MGAECGDGRRGPSLLRHVGTALCCNELHGQVAIATLPEKFHCEHGELAGSRHPLVRGGARSCVAGMCALTALALCHADGEAAGGQVSRRRGVHGKPQLVRRSLGFRRPGQTLTRTHLHSHVPSQPAAIYIAVGAELRGCELQRCEELADVARL